MSILVDINEPPSGLCDPPFVVSIYDSIGAALTPALKAVDPDNEGRDKHKQSLSYYMNNDLNDGVFQLKEHHIMKTKVCLVNKGQLVSYILLLLIARYL